MNSLASLLLMAALATACHASVNHEAMLEAIKLREDSCGKIGSHGERGCYQLVPLNVKKYGGCSKAHAMAHLGHVIAVLTKRGIAPSPFNLGLAWNAGEYNVGRREIPMSAYHYARETRAIYDRILPSFQPTH